MSRELEILRTDGPVTNAYRMLLGLGEIRVGAVTIPIESIVRDEVAARVKLATDIVEGWRARQVEVGDRVARISTDLIRRGANTAGDGDENVSETL
jgi:hypothetical protein